MTIVEPTADHRAPVTPVRPGSPARLLAGAPLTTWPAHQAHWGRLPAVTPGLVGEIGRAGLLGRGGAAFPVATKLAAVGSRRGGIVVANATEGEPASHKDKTLLATVPHLVLDGAVAAAAAIGADEVVVAVDRTSPRSAETMASAIRERRSDHLPISLARAPGRYLTGQETALVRWLQGRDAKPTTSPPRPSERGIDGRPTLVQNVESLAHIALIARYGAGWYREMGTESDPGTTLVTLSGAVARPGVYEIPLGARLADVADAAGGATGPIGPVLVGGYSGRWLPTSAWNEPLTHQGGLATGVISVLPATACGLAETARVLRWLAGQRANQCGPCAHGLPAMVAGLDAVVAGEPSGRALGQLTRWASMVTGRGACHLPDGAVQFVRSALDVFAEDIDDHRSRGACTASPALLPTPHTDGWR